MFVVPLIVEKLYEKVESAIKDSNKEKQYKLISKVTYFLYQHGIDVSHLFFKEITNAFGGRLKRLMCGGAPLKTSIIRKYNALKTVDGEIWARGISVSVGYYNDSTETEKAFCNGWFKTGDLGYIDKDGFVFLTGRKKNLIILDNGKNVSAEELEDYICQIPAYKNINNFCIRSTPFEKTTTKKIKRTR